MPSVDLREFIDLTPYDRTETELVDRAKTWMAAKFPGWNPPEGSLDLALIEAFAVVVAEDVYAVNRIPGALAEGIAALYGETRDLGAAPTTSVTFHFGDALGHVVPGGTRVRLVVGADQVVFVTDADAVAVAPAVVATIGATGETLTSAANGVAAGVLLDPLDMLPDVDTVELAAVVGNGRDPEDQGAFLNRFGARLRLLVTTLVRPEQFTDFVLSDPAVSRATSIDRWDPTVPGVVLGHVTVAVSGPGGAALSAGVKAALLTDLQEAASGDLTVHVIDPTITAVAITTTVLRFAGFTDAEVQANVLAALDAYLNPDTWGAGVNPWPATVYRNELLSVIDSAEGVDRVVSLTVPAGDTALAGTAPLADLGATAITVQAP